MFDLASLGMDTPHVLVEDRSCRDGPALLFTRPVEIIRADSIGEVDGALAAMEAALARGLYAAGYFAYELGYAFEPRLHGRLPSARDLPLLWFGLFHAPARLSPDALDAEFAKHPPPPVRSLDFANGPAEHLDQVRRVLAYIGAGDAYQINLTFPVRFDYRGTPLALYAAMRAGQPVAHGGMVATGTETILSVSPELFIETRSGRATTRPMKGTAPRGIDPETDHAAKQALAADPKQRAENLMIVDLLRNDLSRVSVIGTVEVPDLFTVETYPTLHTLTSTVTGRLEPGLPLKRLVRAMFPCGSITGAPKLRAMEIIRELETAPRGIYTGSIGMIAPNGDVRLNVAIRTAVLKPCGVGLYGVGGGIVADSDPVGEYEECLLKARVLTDLAEDYALFETLRWTPEGGYRRLSRHLDRLSASAQLLGFRFDRGAILAELDAFAHGFPAGADRRVRFELARDGGISVTVSEFAPAPSATVRVAVAASVADRADPFVRHKTTRRGRFDAAFEAATATGANDALFLNREGFVTETTRANIFLPGDGTLWTPPLMHGLLPGVLRDELLQTGQAREAAIKLSDLSDAGIWFIGNSLRGLQKAQLFG